jgi:hypothetical protein
MRIARTMGQGLLVAAGALLLGASGAMAGPPAGSTVYSWTTEDGTVAFADDWKRVPARYRDGAAKRTRASLAGYARYTPQPAAAATDYAARLAARLEHLSAVNAAPAARETAAAPAPGGARLLLRTGSSAAPAIEVTGVDSEPVVVETLRYLPPGRIVTRHDTVVRQGDRILSVVKQRQRGETNVTEDIRDERELP